MKRSMLSIAIIAVIGILCSCQRQSIGNKEKKALLIYGQDFIFSITEPDGWTVDIDDAQRRKLNAYFTIDGYAYDDTPALIYIRVMQKNGHSIAEHLKGDMSDFTQWRKQVVFVPFTIDSLTGDYVSQTYLIDNQTCDRLCYLDPGDRYQSYVIFVLTSNLDNRGKYDALFVKMLRSFHWLGDKVNSK